MRLKILKKIEESMDLLEKFNEKIIKSINSDDCTLEIIELATKSNLYTLMLIKIHQDLNNNIFIEKEEDNILRTIEIISNFCIKNGETYV